MSFLRLNEFDGKVVIAEYLAVRRSPTFPLNWEISCIVVDMTSDPPMPSVVWVPLNQIGKYPPGSVLGRRPGRFSTAYEKIKLSNLRYFSTSSRDHIGSTKFSIDLFQPKATASYLWENGNPLKLMYKCNGGGSLFNPQEMFRFYCGSISHLVEPLLNAVHNSDGSLDHIINPNETGFDGDTLVLAPRRSFCGLLPILQLSVALSDVLLNSILRIAFNQIKTQLATSPTAVPFVPPNAELNLVVRAEKAWAEIYSGKGRIETFVREIVADLREPGFQNLVVRFPLTNDEPDLVRPGSDGPPIPGEEAHFVTHRTNLSHQHQPGSKTVRVGSLRGRFSEAFPRWKNVKIRYDYRRPRTTKRDVGATVPTQSAIPIEATVASELPSTRPGKTLRVSHLTSQDHALSPAAPVVRHPSEFLRDPATMALEWSTATFESLPRMLQTFVRAGIELINWQDFHYSPNAAADAGMVRTLLLPPSWGSLANPFTDGSRRRVLAIPLMFDHGFVWAIEVERFRRRECFSIGLASSNHSQADPFDFLSNVLFAVCRRQRKRRGSDPHGNWPNAQFLDVRLGSLTHTVSRAHYLSLADDLIQRSLLLLQPSTEP